MGSMTTPPMTNPDEALIVKPCDRDAAGEMWLDFNGGQHPHPNDGSAAEQLEAAAWYFARHRLSALKSQQARIEGLEGALERIADPRNTHFAGDAQVVARATLSIAKEGE